MELYYLMSVVNRKQAVAMQDIYRKQHLSVVLTNYGRGTATSEHLSLYDLEPSEKAVIGSVATTESMKSLIRAAKKELYIDVPGNGVMMAIPLKSVSGGTSLAHLTEGQTIGGTRPDMNFEHELIIVILNEGHADTVMNAARGAGAEGGTVLHAKGTGQETTRRFFGVSIAKEKDLIYILAAAGKKSEIMKRINTDCGPETPPGAICFSLPVSEVCGIRCMDDDHE